MVVDTKCRNCGDSLRNCNFDSYYTERCEPGHEKQFDEEFRCNNCGEYTRIYVSIYVCSEEDK